MTDQNRRMRLSLPYRPSKLNTEHSKGELLLVVLPPFSNLAPTVQGHYYIECFYTL